MTGTQSPISGSALDPPSGLVRPQPRPLCPLLSSFVQNRLPIRQRRKWRFPTAAVAAGVILSAGTTTWRMASRIGLGAVASNGRPPGDRDERYPQGGFPGRRRRCHPTGAGSILHPPDIGTASQRNVRDGLGGQPAAAARRRRLSTARPARVRMRSRKPWRFLRRRAFG
jgi:hypothetical protein